MWSQCGQGKIKTAIEAVYLITGRGSRTDGKALQSLTNPLFRGFFCPNSNHVLPSFSKNVVKDVVTEIIDSKDQYKSYK
jgi:hypothetical protein